MRAAAPLSELGHPLGWPRKWACSSKPSGDNRTCLHAHAGVRVSLARACGCVRAHTCALEAKSHLPEQRLRSMPAKGSICLFCLQSAKILSKEWKRRSPWGPSAMCSVLSKRKKKGTHQRRGLTREGDSPGKGTHQGSLVCGSEQKKGEGDSPGKPCMWASRGTGRTLGLKLNSPALLMPSHAPRSCVRH